MSLRKKPTTTEKRVAASKANGRRSRGPATPEGRERVREASTRHGFCSQAEGVALRGLGEKEFDAVVKGLKGPSPRKRAAEIAPTHPTRGSCGECKTPTFGKCGAKPTCC